ncbi:Inner membrane protein YabI [Buchnera aphidicola (Thelaxes suberi)]|uniref:DedA family protein n=1 Tax=Buchnera aphidicola TaxID=9 RepID=UPI003464B985
MESWLLFLKKQPIEYALILVGITSFIASLPIIGLLFPSIVLMTGVGILIGDRQLNVYFAWISGIAGCLLGDWISYYVGWKCKNWLSNLFLLKKYYSIFEFTKKALHKYSHFTILMGRFIGPTRPIVPIIAGMLQLPISKFFLPNIIACIFWPILYFIPGICAGIAINTPELIEQNDYFKIIIIFIILINCFGVWLLWRGWKAYKYNIMLFSISYKKLFFFAFIMLCAGIISLILIQFHPKMYIFRQSLHKIFLMI